MASFGKQTPVKYPMDYERFEDLPVWRDAIRLAERVYALTERAPFRLRFSLRDQLERAAVAVSSNIAEGFERSSAAEMLRYVDQARGAAGATRSILALFDRLEEFKDYRHELQHLQSASESCAHQLRTWAEVLQQPSAEDAPGPAAVASAISPEKREELIRARALQETQALEERFLAALPANHPFRQARAQ